MTAQNLLVCLNLGGVPQGLSPVVFLQALQARKWPPHAVQQGTWDVGVKSPPPPKGKTEGNMGLRQCRP